MKMIGSLSFRPITICPVHFVPFIWSHGHFVPFIVSPLFSSQNQFVSFFSSHRFCPFSFRPIHFVSLFSSPTSCPSLFVPYILPPIFLSHPRFCLRQHVLPQPLPLNKSYITILIKTQYHLTRSPVFNI